MGSGANWSYVRPAAADSDIVIETTEKIPVSDLCCTGLYHFRSAEIFLSAYEEFYHEFSSGNGQPERYVAPIYNALIKHGCVIRYTVIEPSELILCGVPAEYEAFLNRPLAAGTR